MTDAPKTKAPRPWCQRCQREWETDMNHHCPTNEELMRAALIRLADVLERLDSRLALNPDYGSPLPKVDA